MGHASLERETHPPPPPDGGVTAISLLIMIHVFTSPEFIFTLPAALQSPLKVCVYKGLVVSLATYVPAARVYKVPTAVPEAGLPTTLFPKRLRYKSKLEARAVPQLSRTTCLITFKVPVPNEEAPQLGTVIVVLSVVTVSANAKALPNHTVFAPTVIPASSITVPTKLLSAPSVVATGVQKTSQAEAPPVNTTFILAAVVSAPVGLNIYVPAPLKVIPGAELIDIAPAIQYTPGTKG